MRGYVAVMMAERQACLDDLAPHGLTPAVYGLERGPGPHRQRMSRDPCG